MTVFCCVYSRTLTLDGGKPRSISTDGTVSPTLMVFLPKGPAAAVAPVLVRRGSAACYALLLTAQVASSGEAPTLLQGQSRHARATQRLFLGPERGEALPRAVVNPLDLSIVEGAYLFPQ